ncbi:MAG TPA: sigma-70 family RNA polymerase sigma factor [Solirubrobacterales bacterium]|jgi:RNA polymerase sigma factor (sigma-70 family)
MGGSDDRLARRASKGDRRAFEAIYQRYQHDLYRFCLAMTGHPQDAQDALQNTMVKVLRSLPGEQRTIKLKPWLYRIARNETIEVRRRRRRVEQLAPEHSPETTVAETAELREHLRTLLADLDRLPQRQRAVLLMRELSGLEFTEIGEAFDTTPGAVRQTLYEARLKLQELEERRRGVSGPRRREGDLAAVAPLPAAVAAGLLRKTLAGQAGGVAAEASATGLGGSIGAGVGQTVATSALVKSSALIAVVAAAGFGAADRGGLVDLPLPGEPSSPAQARSDVPGQAAPTAAARELARRDEHPAETRGSGDGDAAGPGSNREWAAERTTPSAKHDATGQHETADPAGGESQSPAAHQQAPGDRPDRSSGAGSDTPKPLPPAGDEGQQTAVSRKPPQAPVEPGPPDAAEGNPPPGIGGAPSPAAEAPRPPGTPAPKPQTGPPGPAQSSVPERGSSVQKMPAN